MELVEGLDGDGNGAVATEGHVCGSRVVADLPGDAHGVNTHFVQHVHYLPGAVPSCGDKNVYRKENFESFKKDPEKYISE